MNNNALKKELVKYILDNHRVISIVEQWKEGTDLSTSCIEITLAHGKTLKSRFVFDYHLEIVNQEINPKTKASHYAKFSDLLKFAEEKHRQMLTSAQAWYAIEKIDNL